MSSTTLNYIYNYIKAILINQGKINFSTIAFQSESISHDALTRTCNKKFPWQTLYWAFIQALVDTGGGYLIIDDTILEKPFSRLNTFVRYVFSHKDEKIVKGIQVVLLLYVIGNLRLPLGFRIYTKRQTKIELALELLSMARNKYQLRHQIVLFDSWYSCNKILKRINDYGWHYVCRIKSNRTVVPKVKVKHYFRSPYGIERIRIGGMPVVLVRHRKHYFITNYLSLTQDEIRTWYSKRFTIEEIFKELKSYFNAKDCQSRTEEAWNNHLFFVKMSFCFVEFKRQAYNLSVYKARLKFNFEDYTSYMNLLNSILANA